MIARMSVPASRPMAFLSDIHGNLTALEAVLSELADRAVTDVLVAGDHLLGGREPLEVWRRLQQIGARCTRGASDAALATIDPDNLSPSTAQERIKAEHFAQARRALGDLVIERLKRMPTSLRVPLIDGSEVVMVHGCPADPYQGIGHDVDDTELMAMLSDDPADVVVCGATHVPFRRDLESVRVVNVGSVGDAPEGPVAHYTVLSPSPHGLEIEQHWVEY